MGGTFNQGAPLDRLKHLKLSVQLGSNLFHSYDLSSARNRLPVALQRDVLYCLLADRYAEPWSSLLVERDWFLKGITYRYSVGQPMGALSSWGMLAYTHHIIVRRSAFRVRVINFDHYALLGDDIVIANDAVASCYHYIMTEVLVVEVNLSKCLVSAHCFEFANRFISMSGEYTPVGTKNLLLGLKSPRCVTSILLDLKQKGFVLIEPILGSMFQSIPLVRKN